MQKLICKNPHLDLVNINAYAKFGHYDLKILSGNKILTLIKGHNSVTNWLKLMCNNRKLDLDNNIAYAKLGQNNSICSHDIEQTNSNHNNSIPN